ncbi:MAG: hypothetical protein RIR93_509, partial [Actinomycetota bacterium]
MKQSQESSLSGAMRVVGRLVDASNATLLAEIESEKKSQK